MVPEDLWGSSLALRPYCSGFTMVETEALWVGASPGPPVPSAPVSPGVGLLLFPTHRPSLVCKTPALRLSAGDACLDLDP